MRAAKQTAFFRTVPRREGAHDDLHAKALELEKDEVKVALFTCDLVWLPRNLSEQVRQIIQTKTGIPGDHVMISAPHDYTGPSS